MTRKPDLRRDQLEHAIRAACDIVAVDEVVIIGSQSVLGSWDEVTLPELATLSAEVDIIADRADQDRAVRLADQLEGVAGEFSLFHSTHDFYIDGCDLTTAALPDGWRDRLVRVQNNNTNGHTGWCLDPYDLCVAKLVANREKDQYFVAALIEAGLISGPVLRDRATHLPGSVTTGMRSCVSS